MKELQEHQSKIAILLSAFCWLRVTAVRGGWEDEDRAGSAAAVRRGGKRGRGLRGGQVFSLNFDSSPKPESHQHRQHGNMM
jgi:hypothetical protein